MASTFTTHVEQEGDDLVLQFPPEMIAELGWQPGDTLRWIDNEDGTFTLVRKE